MKQIDAKITVLKTGYKLGNLVRKYISDIPPLGSSCSNSARSSASTKVHGAATRHGQQTGEKENYKEEMWDVSLALLTLQSYNQIVYFPEQANHFKEEIFIPGSLLYWI